jgi:putative toxin-antitoxin system antitoxin component (TIGR02293 family)
MKKYTNYELIEDACKGAEEPSVAYLQNATQTGLPFNTFTTITNNIPFNQNEWSNVLHLSERTFQRYKKEKKKFEPIYAEKILEITLLFNKGIMVFADANNFYAWLIQKNIAIGNIRPIDVLTNSFGIQMLRDELGRIEHGIFS